MLVDCPGAGPADQPDELARLDAEMAVEQDLLVLGVAEIDVVELDPPLRAWHGLGAGRVLDVGPSSRMEKESHRCHNRGVDAAQIRWLLEGDPAVRWFAMAHLTDASPSDVQSERAKVATSGWGKRLLSEQGPDGRWAGADYSPKWTSTTYTLLHLMWLGLEPGHPQALQGLDRLWEWERRWVPEACIESMLVRLTCAFDAPHERLDQVVADLLDQQHEDGGWNCRTRTDRRKHSSFHTSIQVLEALQAYQGAGGGLDTEQAQADGQAFFLRHRLYQSHRTGEIAIPSSTRFPAFPEWHFDVLRGLEYFASVSAPRDERLADGIEMLVGKRRGDGRWPRYAPHAGRQWFDLESRGPSRVTTARAERVLRWWHRR